MIPSSHFRTAMVPAPSARDDYFQADDVQYPTTTTFSLDLTEIRQEQESIVIRHLADGAFRPSNGSPYRPS